MTRKTFPTSCFLVALMLMVFKPALGGSEPAASKPKPAAAKPDSAKQKPKTAEAEPKAESPKPPSAEAKPKAEKAKPQPKTGPQAPEGPKPSTHKVKPGVFKIDVALDGVFQPQTMSEVALRPDSWSSFEVVKAVEHGESVSRGDVLVQFDSKDIDRAVADQRTSQKLADLSFQQAEISLRILQQTTPMDVALAGRDRKRADEDLARFMKVDRGMYRKSAEQTLKSAQNSLEYQLEELRQLEKMYKADDLTEETEEIILKRQRDLVERYKYYLEQAKVYHEEMLKVDLPRSEENIKLSTRAVGLAADKAQKTLPLEFKREEIGLEKMKVQRERDEEKLKKLLGDQALMTIKSPADGVVYYGKWDRGQWSGGSTMAQKLRAGQSVPANSVLMTIVNPRTLVVRVTVPEDKVHWIRRGLKGTVHPVAYPDLKPTATVAAFDPVPKADGKFVATLRVALDPEAESIMPGMHCKVKLTPYLKRTALSVPSSAVQTDELDESRHYVQLVDQTGKPRKQLVTVGKKTADRIEILDGLVAGNEVLKQYPKDEE